MPRSDDDAAHLWDMLDAARQIQHFTAKLNWHSFEQDRKLQLAVERLLEIIGEAANRVSRDFQAEAASIPWRGIIAQRNVIAHEYGDIQQERVWVIVTDHIPPLIRELEAALPKDMIGDQ